MKGYYQCVALFVFCCNWVAFSLLVDDVFVPDDCVAIAKPSDHLLIEYVAHSNGEVLLPSYEIPGSLFHVLLEPTDNSPVHRALKGMCINGTRLLTFPKGIDMNPDPLPISKYAAENVEDAVTVKVTLRHITPVADYQIFNAFKMGNMSEVMHMIEEHKGVNAVDEWGTTILMHAVKKSNINVVASLLNTRLPKVDVNMAKSNGYTALFYAVDLPSTSIMKALLRRGANPNSSVTQKGSEGTTPLHVACMLEKVKHAEMLIEFGADVTAVNHNGVHPLELVPKDAVHSTKLYFRRIFQDALKRKETAEQGTQSVKSVRKDL